MTGLAFFLELAAMRIRVTRSAGIVLHVLVARRAARSIWLVAFLTCHLDVQAGQWKPRLGVIKLFCRFPAFHVVAPRAFVPELPPMRVRVAGHARRGLREEGSGRVLVLNQRFPRWDHVRRHVAFFASNSGVFSLEGIAR